MKKQIIVTVVILVAIILIALIFDWGRGGNNIPKDSNINVSSSSTDEQKSFFGSELPIVVKNIKDNQEVSSPVKIVGKAKGNWFFEGSFPIDLVDTNDNLIGSAIAKADGDWMTTDYVNFTASLEYDKSTSSKHALLVLSKDNPSDNPDFDQSIFIPVILK